MNKLHKEKALLNAAFDLFLKYGVKKTSISDITEKAGVAKGTFYLYFKDKYELRDKLVGLKATDVFLKAYKLLLSEGKEEMSVEEKIIFMLDKSIDQLSVNKQLMSFVATNLDWAILKNAIIRQEDGNTTIIDSYHRLVEQSENQYSNIEVMLFMIIELTNSTCYNAVIYQSPLNVEELKPELFAAVRAIMDLYRI